ncbi:MAG: hypothetical protein U0X39_03345 [Bacteroidales bacterium]
MSFADFITDNGKRVKRDHYIHLVQVAEIDGKIDKAEMEMLHREGRKFGLTDPEIDQIIDKEKDFHYVPPYSLREKFEELYNIAVMMLADEVVTESETRMLNRYAIAAGFDDAAIAGLNEILINGIRNGVDEEDLFKDYRRRFPVAG